MRKAWRARLLARHISVRGVECAGCMHPSVTTTDVPHELQQICVQTPAGAATTWFRAPALLRRLAEGEGRGAGSDRLVERTELLGHPYPVVGEGRRVELAEDKVGGDSQARPDLDG